MEDSSFEYEFNDSESQLKSIKLVRGGYIKESVFQPHNQFKRLVLSVRDDGYGIDPKDISHIHRLFGY